MAYFPSRTCGIFLPYVPIDTDILDKPPRQSKGLDWATDG